LCSLNNELEIMNEEVEILREENRRSLHCGRDDKGEGRF
jgi:hypothetical protein